MGNGFLTYKVHQSSALSFCQRWPCLQTNLPCPAHALSRLLHPRASTSRRHGRSAKQLGCIRLPAHSCRSGSVDVADSHKRFTQRRCHCSLTGCRTPRPCTVRRLSSTSSCDVMQERADDPPLLGTVATLTHMALRQEQAHHRVQWTQNLAGPDERVSAVGSIEIFRGLLNLCRQIQRLLGFLIGSLTSTNGLGLLKGSQNNT